MDVPSLKSLALHHIINLFYATGESVRLPHMLAEEAIGHVFRRISALYPHRAAEWERDVRQGHMTDAKLGEIKFTLRVNSRGSEHIAKGHASAIDALVMSLRMCA
jgi:hypothetical protein